MNRRDFIKRLFAGAAVAAVAPAALLLAKAPDPQRIVSWDPAAPGGDWTTAIAYWRGDMIVVDGEAAECMTSFFEFRQHQLGDLLRDVPKVTRETWEFVNAVEKRPFAS